MLEGRRPAADPPRPRHRPASVRHDARGRLPRHRAALASALGSHAGPAVLRAAASSGLDARRLRPAPGRRPARRRVRADDAAAVLPDPARPICPPTSASTTPAKTTSPSGSPRCARVGCATWARRSASASSGTARRSRTSPITVRARSPTDADDYIPPGSARALRRRRPADPRRAAHARRSTSPSATGATARSSTRCTSRAKPACAASCCSITTRCTATTRWTASRADARDLADAMGIPELDRRPRPAAAPPRRAPRGPSAASEAPMSPCGPPPARSRRRDLPDRARSLRDRRRDRDRDRRRRARRDGVQLVHVGVARAAARVVLRGEVVVARGRTSRRRASGPRTSSTRTREEICRLFAQKGADRFAHISFAPGPHRLADPRGRARVRRLRDDRRARRRRPRDRRRAGGRAGLPARGQAAALLPGRVRPIRELTARRLESPVNAASLALAARVVLAAVLAASAIAKLRAHARRCRRGSMQPQMGRLVGERFAPMIGPVLPAGRDRSWRSRWLRGGARCRAWSRSCCSPRSPSCSCARRRGTCRACASASSRLEAPVGPAAIVRNGVLGRAGGARDRRSRRARRWSATVVLIVGVRRDHRGRGARRATEPSDAATSGGSGRARSRRGARRWWPRPRRRPPSARVTIQPRPPRPMRSRSVATPSSAAAEESWAWTAAAGTTRGGGESAGRDRARRRAGGTGCRPARARARAEEHGQHRDHPRAGGTRTRPA